MPIHNLVEYSDAYLKEHSLQYYRYERAMESNGILLIFLLITITVLRSN